MIPNVTPGRRTSGSFASEARGGRRTGWTIALPPGARFGASALPVAVVLDGRGNDHESAFSPDYLGLDRFLAAAVDAGAKPFAIASVDGGESYWHPRASGEDAGRGIAPALIRVASRANGLSGACQPGSRTGTPGLRAVVLPFRVCFESAPDG